MKLSVHFLTTTVWQPAAWFPSRFGFRMWGLVSQPQMWSQDWCWLIGWWAHQARSVFTFSAGAASTAPPSLTASSPGAT